jgi:hypothetical protein
VLQSVVRQALASLHRGDGGQHGGPRRDDVGRLAEVERDRRALLLDEEPCRIAEPSGDVDAERGRAFDERLERRVDADPQTLRSIAPSEHPRLEAVIAVVGEPTDAYPPGDIEGRPTGQDGDQQPLRPGAASRARAVAGRPVPRARSRVAIGSIG